MRGCVVKQAAAPSAMAGRVTCSHADILTWGVSPSEHVGGVSKAEVNRLKTKFYNSAQRRCTLCDASLEISFSAHCGYVGHMARVGILERATAMLQKEQAPAMTGNSACASALSVANKVKALLEMWWGRLNDVEQETVLDYKRIASLSASTARERLWRVRFLLEFLRDREVIRDSLRLVTGTTSSEACFVRTKRFERSEMIGDNIVKVVVPDRLVRLFPAAEGGVTYKLACIQQLLDSNEGLLQIYDYIDLDSIIGTRLPNSKTKSDVVESLFGELQTFLWASEVAHGPIRYPAVPTSEHRYVRALVDHLLNELTHMLIMWRIESTLENAKGFLEEQLQRKSLQQRSVLKMGTSDSVILKEADYDRGRYAVLPLLMSFPHVRSLAASRQTGAQPTATPAVLHVKKQGTPLMLFAEPVPKSSALASHYRTRLRVVRSAKEHRLEVLAALSKKVNENSGDVLTSSSSSSHVSRGVKNSECEKAKHRPQNNIPWMEICIEKYPTWARDVQLAEVRRHVEDHLTRRGVYVETPDWGGMMAALAQSLTGPSAVTHVPSLHNESTTRAARAFLVEPSTLVTSAERVMLLDQLCIPSLKTTLH